MPAGAIADMIQHAGEEEIAGEGGETILILILIGSGEGVARRAAALFPAINPL